MWTCLEFGESDIVDNLAWARVIDISMAIHLFFFPLRNPTVSLIPLVPDKLLQVMSAIHHSGEKYEYIDARRISLRAPPAPNPVSTHTDIFILPQSNPTLHSNTAPCPNDPTRTLRRLAPEHWDVGGHSAA